MEDSKMYNALAQVFGREWLQLTEADRVLIVRDCVEAENEERRDFDLAQYRRNIGTGNLESYARTQRVRFAHK
jgi:hypothetical protein